MDCKHLSTKSISFWSLLHGTRDKASLHVAWMLTRQKRPFTESETVRDCMLAIIDEMIVDKKLEESVTSLIKRVPILDALTLCGATG